MNGVANREPFLFLHNSNFNIMLRPRCAYACLGTFGTSVG